MVVYLCCVFIVTVFLLTTSIVHGGVLNPSQVWMAAVIAAVVVGIPALIIRISRNVNRAVDTVSSTLHESAVARCRQAGLSEAQIQEEREKPGIVQQHYGKIAIVGLLIVAAFIPVTWPFFIYMAVRRYRDWKAIQEEGSDGITDVAVSHSPEQPVVHPEGRDLFTHIGR